jgi:hypothetical protein
MKCQTADMIVEKRINGPEFTRVTKRGAAWSGGRLAVVEGQEFTHAGTQDSAQSDPRFGFVTGHEFTRAATVYGNIGFSPCDRLTLVLDIGSLQNTFRRFPQHFGTRYQIPIDICILL